MEEKGKKYKSSIVFHKHTFVKVYTNISTNYYCEFSKENTRKYEDDFCQQLDNDNLRIKIKQCMYS